MIADGCTQRDGGWQRDRPQVTAEDWMGATTYADRWRAIARRWHQAGRLVTPQRRAGATSTTDTCRPQNHRHSENSEKPERLWIGLSATMRLKGATGGNFPGARLLEYDQ